MKNNLVRIVLLTALVGLNWYGFGLALGQEGNPQQMIQAELSAFKEAMARNQRALAQYSWKQKTEMIMDEEIKSTTIEQVQIGPDGQQQKTLISAPPEQKKKRGVKGRVIAKKTAEMKDYMERLMSLSKRYMRPNSDMLKKSLQAGNASLSPSPDGTVTLGFTDYFREGDSLSIQLDKVSQGMNQLSASTYLDGEEDQIRIGLEFSRLGDGTSYLSVMKVDSLDKKLTLKVSCYDHQPVH